LPVTAKAWRQAHSTGYPLFRAISGIDHSKTKAQSPQSTGICERIHKTIMHGFYQVAFRKKLNGSLDEPM
jgi:hypothetical protein